MAVITALDADRLIDADAYHRHGYPWEIWARLRREAPLSRMVTSSGEAYWAVTRYKDLIDIERNAAVFLNEPRMVMDASQGEIPIRMIVNMDPPDHGAYRKLVNARFMPRNIAAVQDFVDEVVNRTLDHAMALGDQVFDLQEVLCNPVPTAVISRFLGVSDDLAPSIHDWTNQSLYPGDPEIARGRPPEQVRTEAIQAMFAVYRDLFEERRAAPRDDLLTDLLNSRINDAPMPDIELYSWCYILTLAGHETTQSTFGAAIHTFMQHPDQLALLRADPDLIPGAIEEVLRYVSPAIHFCRTARHDVEINGQTIPAGEPLVLFYPSANHDDAAFERPDEFDITRTSNRHVAFGSGPHQCLGMHLARLELRIMLTRFLERVESVEPAGTPTAVHSCVVGGFRKYPVRMKVRPRA
ncbi:cytochrome P450 [Novosphingobium bradum]|uniref:Cytochrome P450 n=1 Tax=Novosphingobium bradum TaxID=1737444 RepID=A0ABV7IPE5_9SPHN